MRRIIPIITVVLFCTTLALSACGSAQSGLGLLRGENPPGSALEASGTIEAEEVSVAAQAQGRVIDIQVDEGATVEAGDPLLQLDRELLVAQREGAQSKVAQAQAALAAARARLAMARSGARPEERDAARSALAAAEAHLEAARVQEGAAAKRVAGARAGLAAAEGQLASSQAGLDLAQAQKDAAEALLREARAGATAEDLAIAERAVEVARNALWGVQASRDATCGQVGRGASQADCDRAEAAVQAAEEEVRMAELRLDQARRGPRAEQIDALVAQVAQTQAAIDAAQAGLQVAQANRDASAVAVALAQADLESARIAPEIAAAQRDGAQAQLNLVLAGSRPEELEQLQAQLAQAEALLEGARAAQREIEIQLERTTVIAPIGGVILDVLTQVGELASPAVPLFTLADLGDLRLTVYIPEADLGRVHLDQPVRVSVDAYRESFAGRVIHIARKAEFTPKNVETREERVHMVFAVEIALDNGPGKLLPGMPADVIFEE